MVKNKNLRNSIKKPVVISVFMLVILLACGWWFVLRSKNEPPSDQSDVVSEGQVNYDPPSEEEVIANDKTKDEIANQQDKASNSNSSDGKKKVSVILTNWGLEGSRFEIGAYVNTLDASGSCSIVLKKGSTILKGTSRAVRNPSTMSCGGLSVDGKKITSGNWNATITYRSENASGSLDKIIKVQ